MWDLILNPFVTILAWLYAALNQDIVLAIVVLTVIIRFLTYPLLAKQQESSRKMQQLQPQLKKLQEKYKNDKEKMSQAQMKLYRENKVNPVGGCFPMVIQFPILIGLYQAIFFCARRDSLPVGRSLGALAYTRAGFADSAAKNVDADTPAGGAAARIGLDAGADRESPLFAAAAAAGFGYHLGAAKADDDDHQGEVG